MNGPMGGSKLIRENNVGGWLKCILDLFIYPLSTQTFCFLQRLILNASPFDLV